jgi:hypothetical protein
VADARVDGRKELISALARESDSKQSILADAPDVELILRAYLTWGESCLEHLLGDFAFVIWDASRQLLRCGARPLRRKAAVLRENRQCGVDQQHTRLPPAMPCHFGSPGRSRYLG